MPSISNLHKRRGVVRGSISQLATCLRELEKITDQPRTADHTSQLLAKFESLDGEFKAIHFEIINLLDESEDLEKEQTVLDKHDNVSTLTFTCKHCQPKACRNTFDCGHKEAIILQIYTPGEVIKID